jgi:hypothetical protein
MTRVGFNTLLLLPKTFSHEIAGGLVPGVVDPMKRVRRVFYR